MRPLFVLLRFVVGAWAVVFALWLYWLTQRYKSSRACPYAWRWMLDNLPRRVVQAVRSTVDSFRIGKGQTVLELGPGPGYFTVEVARRLGAEGRLVCVDIQPEMVGALRRRLLREGVANALPMVGDALALPLVDSSVDCAFLVTVLGEIPDRPRALAELRRVLKPDGILSVTETLPDPDYQFADVVRDLCRASGFRLLEHRRRFLGFTMNFAVADVDRASGGGYHRTSP
ncbi:MAG: class I SAM-dependent methyltransferase [Dehalococcoidia bacterium]